MPHEVSEAISHALKLAAIIGYGEVSLGEVPKLYIRLECPYLSVANELVL
jgi:hypothetical protein